MHTQVAQKQMMRVDMYARALRASQNAKRSKVRAAKLQKERGAEELVLKSFVVVFGPVLRTRIPGRMRQPSDDARAASVMPGSRPRGTYLSPEASW